MAHVVVIGLLVVVVRTLRVGLREMQPGERLWGFKEFVGALLFGVGLTQFEQATFVGILLVDELIPLAIMAAWNRKLRVAQARWSHWIGLGICVVEPIYWIVGRWIST